MQQHLLLHLLLLLSKCYLLLLLLLRNCSLLATLDVMSVVVVIEQGLSVVVERFFTGEQALPAVFEQWLTVIVERLLCVVVAINNTLLIVAPDKVMMAMEAWE